MDLHWSIDVVERIGEKTAFFVVEIIGIVMKSQLVFSSYGETQDGVQTENGEVAWSGSSLPVAILGLPDAVVRTVSLILRLFLLFAVIFLELLVSFVIISVW